MNADPQEIAADEPKPLQFRLLSLFVLVTAAAVAAWLGPVVYRALPPAPLDISAIVPGLLIAYPFLILGAIDLIVEWHHRRKRS